jgi:hypothetical protein
MRASASARSLGPDPDERQIGTVPPPLPAPNRLDGLCTSRWNLATHCTSAIRFDGHVIVEELRHDREQCADPRNTEVWGSALLSPTAGGEAGRAGGKEQGNEDGPGVDGHSMVEYFRAFRAKL